MVDIAKPKTSKRAALKALLDMDVKKIDIDAAAAHFDLPIADLFENKRALLQGLAATRAEFLAMFDGEESINVWRGMSVDEGWAKNLKNGHPVGMCWSWAEDGAVKGANLDSRGDGQVLLLGRVFPEDIDWATTIAVNTFHEDEKEILINEGANLMLDSVVEWPSGAVLFTSPYGLAVEALKDLDGYQENEAESIGCAP